MKLIKQPKFFHISDTHYIVVDDSEIKPCQPANVCMAHRTKPCDKCGKYQGMRIVKEPSLSEVEEAINGYSVGKMALDFCDNIVKPKDETRFQRSQRTCEG